MYIPCSFHNAWIHNVHYHVAILIDAFYFLKLPTVNNKNVKLRFVHI